MTRSKSVRSLVLGLALALAPKAATPEPAQSLPSVGKHKTLELVFTAAGTPANPFDTVLLKLEVTDPAGRVFTVEGFYDGDGNGGQSGRIWKARLCPYRTGTWSWRTLPGDASDGGLAGRSGQFQCSSSGDLGGLVAQGRYFRLQDGGAFFPVGSFLDVAGGLPLWSFLGEEVTSAQRDGIIARQRDFHTASKYMFYMTNHSDDSGTFSEVVTPWVGTKASSDKTRMNLGRWKLYDGYLRRMKDNGMLAYMSIFEDGKPGNYGDLPMADRKRLMRYMMARTSAFSHLWYVLCFEWQEAWTQAEVNDAGAFLQAHNPWRRLHSVHDWGLEPWAYGGETWPSYIASQQGNRSNPDQINSHVLSLRAHGLPVLADEFGANTTDSDARIRSNLWAAFCGGAAATGTGTELKAFQRFLSQSKVPFQRMGPSNGLIQGGGSTRFCLAEIGHHYVAYSRTGSFTLSVSGSGLTGRWFNPRDVNGLLGTSFAVPSGTRTFTPADTAKDWVLWITDGTNLNSGVTHPSTGATVVQIIVDAPPPSPSPRGHWKLDEGTGTAAADASGNGNTGTLVNGPAWTTGKVGGAVRFDGVNDFIRIPDSASLDSVAGRVTVAAWVYKDANQTGWAAIANRQRGASNGEHYFLGFRNDVPEFWIDTTSGEKFVAGPSPAASARWTHIAGTYDGATLRLYLNGVQAAQAAVSGAAFGADATPLTLGASQNDATGAPGEALKGRLDDVRLYNRALSGSEIAGLYGTGGVVVTIDFVSTGRPYSLSTAQVGALSFIDRSYTISSLGAGLSGQTLIRTANDDKTVTAGAHLKFTVNQAAKVHVCYSGAATSVPAWLNDGTWTATAEAFSATDTGSNPRTVYRKSVGAGQVTLGGNRAAPASGPAGYSNYVVIVTP